MLRADPDPLAALDNIILKLRNEDPATTGNKLEKPIEIGVEALLGVRNSYYYRGFHFGKIMCEAQVSSGVSLTNDTFVNFDLFAAHTFEPRNKVWQSELNTQWGWFATNTLTISALANLHDLHGNTIIKSGIEGGLELAWKPLKDWKFSTNWVYSSGQRGGYSTSSIKWMPILASKLALDNTISTSFAADYAGVSGLREILFRSGLLFMVSDSWRLEPWAALNFIYSKQGRFACTYGLWCTYNF